MKLDSIMQLQAMNAMMNNQFNQYQIKTIIVFGIAGGNGLEHIDVNKIEKIYGIDINRKYLNECALRYPALNNILEPLCLDLCDKNIVIPHADMVIANLLIEYIGYECFQNAIRHIKPIYVSCIIQINSDSNFVSDSPYIHVFDNLNEVHHQIQENKILNILQEIGYSLIAKVERPLPNGKKLVQMDFKM
jgi:hypothetical protein